MHQDFAHYADKREPRRSAFSRRRQGPSSLNRQPLLHRRPRFLRPIHPPRTPIKRHPAPSWTESLVDFHKYELGCFADWHGVREELEDDCALQGSDRGF